MICPIEEDNWYFHSEVDVYSLKSNSWHTIIVDSPHNSNVQLSAGRVLMNGAMHWLLLEKGILAFDFGSETFEAVLPPPPIDHSPRSQNISKKLEDLGGCLSVFIHHLDVGSQVDIWVMKDYGVKDSWTKLITVTARELGYSRLPTIPYLRPIACSKSGARILFQRNSRDLAWYDIERKKIIKKIAARGVVYPVVYIESLVSLNLQGEGEGEGDGDIDDLQGYEERRTRRKLSEI